MRMPSPEVSPAKTCVVCGQDCTDRPRVKDNRGRYFCQPCFQKLEQKQKAAAPPQAVAVAAAAKAPAAKPAARSAPAGGPDLLSDLATMAAAAPAAEIERNCPACSKPLAPNAIFCTNCGYNIQTGQRVSVQAMKATKVRKTGSSSAAISGVFANPLALGGILCVVFLVLFLVARGNSQMAGFYLVASVLFGIGIGLWGLIAAFQQGAVSGILYFRSGRISCISSSPKPRARI
jgi:hypothetical protein